MSTELDPRTRTVIDWLREDAHENAERVLLRALDQVESTAQRRRPWRLLPAPVLRGPRLALAAGVLALASVGAALAAGTLLTPEPSASPSPEASPRPVPTTPAAFLGTRGRILVTYPAGPGTMLTIGEAGVASRAVDVSGCPMVVGGLDAVATNTRHVGIEFTAFDGTASDPITLDYAGGERWSPDHRTVALMNFSDSSLTFISIEGSDVEHPVTRRIALDLAGPPPPGDDAVPFDGRFSPDGRRFLLYMNVKGDDASAGHRLTLVDVAAGDPLPLTTLPGAVSDPMLTTAVWSADGASIAAVATRDGSKRLVSVSASGGEPVWLGRPAGLAPEAEMTIEAWSADGSRVAVWAGRQLAVVDTVTAAWTLTPLARPDSLTSVAFAADHRRIAVVAGSMLTIVDVASGAIEQRDLPSAVTSWSPDRSLLVVLEPADSSKSAHVLAIDPWSGASPSVIATVPGGPGPMEAPDDVSGPCVQWLPDPSR